MVIKEKPNQKTILFEDAITHLEKIVNKLENGDLSLDQAISLFEEGSELRKYCETKLDKTEQKVEMIIKNKTSNSIKKITTEEFDENAIDLTKTKGEDILL